MLRLYNWWAVLNRQTARRKTSLRINMWRQWRLDCNKLCISCSANHPHLSPGSTWSLCPTVLASLSEFPFPRGNFCMVTMKAFAERNHSQETDHVLSFQPLWSVYSVFFLPLCDRRLSEKLIGIAAGNCRFHQWIYDRSLEYTLFDSFALKQATEVGKKDLKPIRNSQWYKNPKPSHQNSICESCFGGRSVCKQMIWLPTGRNWSFLD